MDAQQVLNLSAKALLLIILLSSPMLLSALVVGLIISILQATTQIQEQTLSFVPKIIATFLAVLICGAWIAGTLGTFAQQVFRAVAQVR
ncbi:MAG: flagellar biosynthesis protein FliQ [Armatimonadota bacterium]